MISIVSTFFISTTTGLIEFTILSLSSGNQRLGISPVFRRLLISSMNDLDMIYVSVMRKQIDFPSIPLINMSSFIKSRN